MSLLDWSRRFHGFRHLDGRACDWRHAHPGRPRASLEAWRTAPAVRREYFRGYIHGILSVAFGGSLAATLALALYCLGFRP